MEDKKETYECEVCHFVYTEKSAVKITEGKIVCTHCEDDVHE